MTTAMALIRLGGQSFCWVCHEAAHIVKTVNGTVQEEPQAEAAANPRHQEEDHITCTVSSKNEVGIYTSVGVIVIL